LDFGGGADGQDAAGDLLNERAIATDAGGIVVAVEAGD
jgi:hypothetical protein